MSRTARGLRTALALLGAALLLPALVVPSLGVALPLLVVAAANLSAPNPPLDAARLDIIPSRTRWAGQAEPSVSTALSHPRRLERSKSRS